MAFQAIGSGNFKKLETGKSESFSLNVDDIARERIAKGGKLYLVEKPYGNDQHFDQARKL